MNNFQVSPKSKVVIFIPFVAAILSLLLLFVALTNDWFGPAFINGLQFCESMREGLIKQPANTWSNLSFVGVGLTIAFQSYNGQFREKDNRMSKTTFYPTFMAVLCVLLGPGSMAMHASTAAVGGYFDLLSMFLIGALMFAYALHRAINQGSKTFMFIFFLSLGICHYVYFNEEHLGFLNVIIVFGTLVFVGGTIEFFRMYLMKSDVNIYWFYSYAFTFLFAFIIWHHSKTGEVLCNPNSLLQGHAIWHILCALSVYFTFRFYTSENLHQRRKYY